MRPLLIAEAPGMRNGRTRPLDGPSGTRLAACMGLTIEEMRARFNVRNLLAEWPGACGAGSRFPMHAARYAAARVRVAGKPYVILLGKRVASAFGVCAPFLEWCEVRGIRAAVVPHPSGVNHWWNEQANRDAASSFLRALPVTA